MMPILKSPSKCNDDDDFVQPRPPVHRPNRLSLKKRPKQIFPLDETTAKYSQDLKKAVEGSHFEACRVGIRARNQAILNSQFGRPVTEEDLEFQPPKKLKLKAAVSVYEPDLLRMRDLMFESSPNDPPGFSKAWNEPYQETRQEKSNISIFDLADLTMTQGRTIKFLRKMKVLHSSLSCNRCDNPTMGLFDRRENDWYFRCNKRTDGVQCQNQQSIKTGTFFSQSRLNLKQLMYVMYAFTEELPNSWVEQNVGLSARTVVDWFSFLREVCMQAVEDSSNGIQIGGFGVVVEIDESKFVKRKYHRGAAVVSKDWVFGGVERGTNRCFMVVVKDRSQQTLLALIKKYIAPGSIILSDCWKGYKNLRKLLECEHYTVNHTHYFKDPFTHTHTNTIEGTWAHAKRSMPRSGIRDHLLDNYLCKFVWKRNARANSRILFFYLLDCIAQQYPLGFPATVFENVNVSTLPDNFPQDFSFLGQDETEQADMTLIDTTSPSFLPVL